MSWHFGDDVLDLNDIISQRDSLISAQKAGEELDWEEQDWLSLYEQLEDELDDMESRARNEPALIKDTYFEDYAEDYTISIGAIQSGGDWPTNRIDWTAAADDLLDDYHTFQVGPYTYHGRNF